MSDDPSIKPRELRTPYGKEGEEWWAKLSLDELLRTEAVAKRAVAAIKAEWPVRREGGSPSLADILSEEAADGQD
jgi:hypothetical protein